MKLMNGSYFVGSNVFVYLLGDDFSKRLIAYHLLKGEPVISTQVISENINVLYKKFSGKVTNEQIERHKDILFSSAKNVVSIDSELLNLAFIIKGKYMMQWYDSMIVSAALLSNCQILYSEDFQHLQQFEKRLVVINPFRQGGL